MFFSIQSVHAADVEIKIKTPYLEMPPESFQIAPLSAKVEPSGDGNVIMFTTGH
jgi:hypothetical protein